MTELVVADIGGTHARFALARPGPNGASLGPVTTVRTADHASLESAFAGFAAANAPLPPRAVFAVACPTEGEILSFTNNPWVIRPAQLPAALGLSSVRLINDFEAVAHAVSRAQPSQLAPVCGPQPTLPTAGITSIIGPGTGLGVAMLVATPAGQIVVPTEAGHIGFAPADPLEDLLLTAMRRRLAGRVSAERLVSGPGLAAIHLAMGGAPATDEKSLWAEVLAAQTPENTATLDRYLALLGSYTGDIALAQGATAVVIAGGLGTRLGTHLSRPAFQTRFTAKGRFTSRMETIPVMRLLIKEPGLFGAAVAAGVQ